MEPLVSIIIPVFNDRLVVEAVESALNQTYKNIEVIVIDDGSDCYVSKLLEPYKGSITYFKTPNKGVASARNTGIEFSKGEYIAFLDSDDFFLPEKIKTQLEFMEKNSAVFSYTSYKRLDLDTSLIKIVDFVEKEVRFPDIISNCPIAMPTVIIKRDIIKRPFFDTTLDISEDICLWIDLSSKYHFHYLNEALSVVRINDDSSAFNIRKKQVGLLNIINHVTKHYDSFHSQICELIMDYADTFKEKRNHKLKVLFLNAFWLTGGVERVIVNLANGLDDFCDVYVYIYSDLVDCKYQLPRSVNLVCCYDGDNTPKKVIDYIRDNEIDIVVGNSGIIESSLLIYKEIIKNNIKLIVCNHESYFYPFSFYELIPQASKRLEILKNADLVTFTTRYSTCAYNAINANGILMPNLLSSDVDLNFTKATRKHRNVLLAVGRWNDYNKHLDRIIEVYSKVKSIKKDCELYVVGKTILDDLIDIRSVETIRAQIERLNLDNNDIHFVGEIEDVAKYYQLADVFLLTSETEAFAMVLAEAGSYALPSVIMSIPGIDDYVIINEKNGFICQQNNFNEMASKIIALLENDELYDACSKTSLLLADRFSKTKIIDTWKNILSMLNKGDVVGIECLKMENMNLAINKREYSIYCQEYQKCIDLLLNDNPKTYPTQVSFLCMVKKAIKSLKNNGLLYTVKKIKNKIKGEV